MVFIVYNNDVKRTDLFSIILLFAVSILTALDLFLFSGRPATMDGVIHITTIAQFARALSDGDFPVIWLNGFANYGLPVGLFAHQIPSYLGAIFDLLVQDPVLSFNILTFVGVSASSVFFYFFLRIYVSPLYAFLGAFVFNLAPYRIINIYIRGAIPETFSAVFLPVILIALYLWFQKKDLRGFFLFIASVALLVLTHPMMLLTNALLFVPYAFFLIFISSKSKPGVAVKARQLFLFSGALILAVGITAYYLIPLELEAKYFYFGQQMSQFVQNQFLHWANFFDPNWYYFYKTDTFTRGHFIKTGLIETLGVIASLGFVLFYLIKNKKKLFTLLEFGVLVSLIVLFFTTELSSIFYTTLPLLGNIQFPWRMLSIFIFLPPLLFALLFSRMNKSWLAVVFILLIAVVRFPQLYGKNYAAYPNSSYVFNPVNLHSTNMNTIWTGVTEQYPLKKMQYEIIGGQGKMLRAEVKNSKRFYTIRADTPVHLVDYTFFFPGWKVFIDGRETPIQFQDPNYRGVITYDVPQGTHEIAVKFQDTKVRLLAKMVTAAFVLFFVVLFLIRKRLSFLTS